MIYKNADRTFLNEKWRYRAPASGGSNQYRIAGMQTRLHQAVAHSVRIQRARRAVCRLRFLCLFLKYDVGLLLRTLSKHAKRYPAVYSSVLVTLQRLSASVAMGATKFCYSLKSRFSPLNSSASRCPSSEWKNCFQAETIRLRAPSLTINLHAVPFACFRGSRVWTVCVGLGFVCLRWVLCGWGGVGVGGVEIVSAHV